MVCAIPSKKEVLGVNISTTSYQEVAETCSSWITSKRSDDPSPYICVTSVHGVMEARKNPRIRAILNQAAIATPDGMPLVWALRSFGATNQQRVYGPDLMLTLCEQAARLGHRVFLYGSRSETLDSLCAKLPERFPGLKVVGRYSPPFRDLTEDEEAAVISMIRDVAPDILFVGISTPKQEQWMFSHRDLFTGIVMVGVGAAFDFHAGRVKQAPGWMQRHGLEWLFRLGTEPARLWRRYLTVTPWFLPFWAIQKMSMAMQDFARGHENASTKGFRKEEHAG